MNNLIIINFCVTGFVKRGLPHTSNIKNLEDHNFEFIIKRHVMLKLFPAIKLYGVTYYLPNFKSIAFTNLIQSYELSKVVNWMCGRPLFANPVTQKFIIIRLFIVQEISSQIDPIL